jgi:hypothetical protein
VIATELAWALHDYTWVSFTEGRICDVTVPCAVPLHGHLLCQGQPAVAGLVSYLIYESASNAALYHGPTRAFVNWTGALSQSRGRPLALPPWAPMRDAGRPTTPTAAGQQLSPYPWGDSLMVAQRLQSARPQSSTASRRRFPRGVSW